VFETFGVPVYYADDRAKMVMNHKPEVKEKLKVIFGDSIYGEDGVLNKKRMSEKAFADPKLLKRLEAVIHPAVALDFDEWLQHNLQQNRAYIIKEAALLFESGSYKQLDKNILVLAEMEERIQRILKRDSTTREKALQRIENQWSDEDKMPLCDYILHNTGKNLLLPQIIAWHKLFS
jgi:dephospho-CoA kinase